MAVKRLGIDIIEVKRFARFGSGQHHPFLLKNFSPKELDYCFVFKDFAPHLAGIFAAKEAVMKALDLEVAMSSVEIKRNKIGCPIPFVAGRRQKAMQLSISHTAQLAMAVAVQ